MKKTITSLASTAVDALRRIPLGLAHLFGLSSPRAEDRLTISPPEVPVLPSLPEASQRTPLPSKMEPRRVAVDDERGARERASVGRGDGRLHEAAVQRERERCRAIVMSPVGLNQPGLAYHLAFGTRMKRSEALALLEQIDSNDHVRQWGHLANVNLWAWKQATRAFTPPTVH
jgi:hypothetical protein